MFPYCHSISVGAWNVSTFCVPGACGSVRFRPTPQRCLRGRGPDGLLVACVVQSGARPVRHDEKEDEADDGESEGYEELEDQDPPEDDEQSGARCAGRR